MLARCELKEVQGILAFEQLEELYISYNFIEELFDIGFLEHLNVLDMEGNNIKSLDQIYYLKRTPKLQELNLKYNPVTQEVAYYQRV
jgi:Leucine-rich repeat (LRR) protein